MTFRIFTDLSMWPTERLMLSLRRQFAYSVGILILMITPLLCMDILSKLLSPRHDEMYGLIMFLVFELSVWFTFIRAWRELRRRQKQNETDSNHSIHATSPERRA
jgi:Na+/melibiose symporter-like transporter